MDNGWEFTLLIGVTDILDWLVRNYLENCQKVKIFLVSLKENTYYIDLCSVLDTELHGNGSIQSFNWLAILPKKC